MTPIRLTSIVRRSSSSETAPHGPGKQTPALLTSMSIGPPAASAVPAALSHLAGAFAGVAYALVWREQLRTAQRVARVAAGSVVVRS